MRTGGRGIEWGLDKTWALNLLGLGLLISLSQFPLVPVPLLAVWLESHLCNSGTSGSQSQEGNVHVIRGSPHLLQATVPSQRPGQMILQLLTGLPGRGAALLRSSDSGKLPCAGLKSEPSSNFYPWFLFHLLEPNISLMAQVLCELKSAARISSSGSLCLPGHLLDSFARSALWDSGLDYLHGTGHGVGSFLNVHEGPCGISYKTFSDEPLEAGMIVTDGR